ncbi:22066_t:CDS:2 [Cetraspora pellucida]|uniref:22066_t:CDS:1 n=1 Tax=Cetraspora pellucida TaxID=1433469 RepID=A0A9N9A509_9GLOM|nr:22066_t:CDS:2 [Cetraspora pellucida]
MDNELNQNLLTLSNNLLNLLKTSEGFDTKIIVGKGPNIKEFKAHSNILSSRSAYFKNALSSRWAKRENGIIIFNKPNISPLVFEILINYIYTGIFAVGNNVSFVDIFISADEIELLEISQYKDILPDLSDEIFRNLDPRHDLLQKRVSAYPFDSKIINAKDAALIASWIDNKEIPYLFKNIPFNFELIYRASQENFSVRGYNPLDWRSIMNNYNNHECKTSKSFIFSLLSFSNGTIPRLSRISTKSEAIIWCNDKGPCFGLQDLWIQSNSSRRSASGISKQRSYEMGIIDKDTFEIEEYEFIKRFLSNMIQFIKNIIHFFNPSTFQPLFRLLPEQRQQRFSQRDLYSL